MALSEESGDLGGTELELIGLGADARVEFVVCEGWCNAIRKAPVRSTPNGLEFSHNEEYVDQDGLFVRRETYDVVLVREGSGVRVAITPSSSPDWFYGYLHRPIEDRLGLAVAAGED